jgi:hypothetical protein
MSKTAPATSHVWKFFRTGGLDQVSLETGGDLLALDQLDQKLWVALSCPVKGLELDEKTLALIDSDGDGHIRVPELLAAIKWAAAHLNDAGDLLNGSGCLPLSAINLSTPQGRVLLASAKQILTSVGKKDADAILVDEAADTAKIFSSSALNGDGVIPPEATEDPAVQTLIKEIITCLGGTADRAGSIGITAEKIETFFTELVAYQTWITQSATKDIAILGDATEAACNALKAVRAKVEDYFARSRLAAFDGRALAALNRSETEYLVLAAKDMTISAAEVSGFPLARIEAGKALPLLQNVNPAWSAALVELQQKVVAPVLGAQQTTLTDAEWAALNAKFAPYETWLGGKVGSAVEKLGLPRVKEILAGAGRAALADLVARDQALEPAFKAISDVERLTRYYRDLRTLVNNFVNFHDFYSPDRLATFQAGTLYLDSRSTELCIRVEAANPLAAMSKAYIAYCVCTRPGGLTMTIAACFMQGDSDYLFVGRHGIFYDRVDRDWDAVITGIVDNPIGLRQAFWSPYKKFVRMVDEMIAKRAAAADAVAQDKLAAAAKVMANVDKAATDKAAADQAAAAAAGAANAKVDVPKKIDIGAVAAISVGLGAIVGALAAVGAGLKDLKWWDYPLVVLGLMLVISLPAVVIAWLKLRQRTLGPILDGNGWAINGRVKINIPFGSALTERALLPANARRSLEDPYEDKDARRQRRLVYLVVVLIVLGIVAWELQQKGVWTRWRTAIGAPATPVTNTAP